MVKKRTIILILLLFSIILTVLCFFVLRENKSHEIVKIDGNLYYKKLDTDAIAYHKDIGKYVSNELILYTDNVEKQIIEELAAEEGGHIVGYIDITNTYQIEFDSSMEYSSLMSKKQKMEKTEHVKHVAYNYVVPINDNSQFYPNDKEWKNEWEDMEGGNWGLKAIKVPEAWDYINNSYKDLKQIELGVLEVGPLDAEHEDLKDNLGQVYGSADKNNKNAAGHGTQVTGVIGAVYNNKLGITGVMMNNEKINYFSHSKAKGRGESNTMAYLQGLTYLISAAGKDQTAVINVSMGTDVYQVAGTNGIKAAIDDATNQNNEIAYHLKAMLSHGYDFLIVKAAGNATNEPFLHVDEEEDDSRTILRYVPYLDKKDSGYDEYASLYEKYNNELDKRVVSGEIDAANDSFSGITDEEIKARILVVGGIANPEGNEYPLYPHSSKGERIDIAAPATRIETLTFNNGYAKEMNGTSLAAPYVSGVAGLMLTVNPELSGKELKTMIIKTGSGNYNFGIGGQIHNVPLVDAQQAVTTAATYNRNRISVSFDHEIENGQEYATITGINDFGEVVWKYESQRYACTQLNRISEIGNLSDLYYFVEDGKVITLNVSDGTIAWENGDFGGSVSAYVFGDDNTVYLCGYNGPDFIAINRSGKTVHEIEEFSDGNIFWPMKIKYNKNDNTVTITFEGSVYQSIGDMRAVIDLSDYSYTVEGVEINKDDISSKGDTLYGSWLQMDLDDPILLTLNDDGTFQYYSSISQSDIYSGTFRSENNLWLDLLSKGDNHVITVPYQIEIQEEMNSIQMTLVLDKNQLQEDTTELYGMDSILEGKYKLLSFTETQLESIKTSLGVPADADVVITQDQPYYWASGERWLTQVNIYMNNQYVAGAAVDPDTLEMCKDIYMYQ